MRFLSIEELEAQKCESWKKYRYMKNIKKYILGSMIAVLAVSSVLMTVETATSGMEISSLRNKEKELANQKRNLEDTLMRSMSINSLEQKSGEMGYVEPSTLVYVAPSQAVAELPQ
jgi:hypothetical protein